LAGLNDLKPGIRLFISADGPLNFIPFQALWDRGAGRYLIQDHTITYVTGAIPIGRITPLDRKHLVLIGNPDGTLPGAEDEVHQILAIGGLGTGVPLLNSTATVERLRQSLNGAGRVHFATHARANETDPNYAYIQLANTERLYSYNLGGLDFGGKSIFLGACETRVGSALPGDDVYGIADAFLASGALSVVATLWRVETNSSSAFAQRYYALLATGADPSEALAGTARDFIDRKVSVKRNGVDVAIDAPAYWAGFTHLVSAATVSTR
jgi:CHAT domain-containing protein